MVLSNREVRIQINKIKTSSSLTIEQKRLALYALKEKYFTNKVHNDGFTDNDKKNVQEDLQRLREKAIKAGLPELVAEVMDFESLFKYMTYKTGIRTELDESELA
jgi:hypothetical protein